MYINSTNWKPLATHRNALRFDILQLIRICRERKDNSIEKLEDLIKKKKTRVKKKDSLYEQSQSIKTEENRRQLPKLTNRSMARINKRFEEKDHKQQPKESSGSKSNNGLNTKSIHQNRLSLDDHQSKCWEIQKMSYLDKLPNHHFSKKCKIRAIRSNSDFNPELKTLDARIQKLVDQQKIEPNSMLLPVSVQLPRHKPILQRTKSKVQKQSQANNLMTKHGWDFGTNNLWSTIFNS